jgi:hypothetical protein
MSELGFIDPTYIPKREIIPLAKRPASLAGKVIGMLDNTKEQADVIFKTIGDVLVERYGAARIVVMRKEHYTKPASVELLDTMAKDVQIAIAGLGG